MTPGESLLAGRVLLAGGNEFACKARMTSPARAEIFADARAAVQQTAVCAFDGIGMMHGKVTEVFAKSFLVAFALSDERRKKLSAQLEWHESNAARMIEIARAPRIVPIDRQVDVWITQTLVVQGTIIDVSISGAALTLTPDLGLFLDSILLVGTRPAKIVRLLNGGIAVQFVEPLPSANFDERVKL